MLTAGGSGVGTHAGCKLNVNGKLPKLHEFFTCH